MTPTVRKTDNLNAGICFKFRFFTRDSGDIAVLPKFSKFLKFVFNQKIGQGAILLIFLTIVNACAAQVIPIEKQNRSLLVPASVKATFAAVRPALMKNGYQVTEMDAYTGQVAAKKIRKKRYLIVSVKPDPVKGAQVKINLTAKKNGRRISVSDRTMADLDRILTDIEAISASLE